MDTKLFDDWNIQLAKTYKPGLIKPDTWITITEKINGVRATSYGQWLVSRTGHEILGVDHIIDDLRHLNKLLGGGYSFDGELRLHENFANAMSDNDAFKVTVGIANSQKDFSQKTKLQFIIFDVIKTKDLAFEQPTDKYSERLKLLREIKTIIAKDNLFSLRIVPIWYEGTDIRAIFDCSIAVYKQGGEGIMINLDNSYEYKRSGKLLKYKQFNTIDLRILGTQEGTGKYEGTLGALLCKYKNNIVAVGTGFTDEQRHHIWKNKNIWTGMLAEVKYKDITSDKQTGLESLQFPVFLGIKYDKDEPDA